MREFLFLNSGHEYLYEAAAGRCVSAIAKDGRSSFSRRTCTMSSPHRFEYTKEVDNTDINGARFRIPCATWLQSMRSATAKTAFRVWYSGRARRRTAATARADTSGPPRRMSALCMRCKPTVQIGARYVNTSFQTRADRPFGTVRGGCG